MSGWLMAAAVYGVVAIVVSVLWGLAAAVDRGRLASGIFTMLLGLAGSVALGTSVALVVALFVAAGAS